ncbi:MAG: peptidyl-prolyl cis-trans isomerase [Lachnospiraceae bacterium]|jgi:foldase protein PrsA|nr:peptidyl-prolyl cis-trans isomerase [Lachnospiraceae bacterium]
MRTDRKWKVLAICALLFVSLSACKMGDAELVVSSDFIGDEVFKIREEVCTLPQARVILTNYQNMYATMYGIDLWELDSLEQDLETYVKDLTISRLAQIMAMDDLAKEKEISLTDEEKSKIKRAAKDYFDSLNEAERDYMQVRQSDIEKLYTRYGLANKLYTFLTQGVDDEVSDEEARVMDAQQIFVLDKKKAKEVEQQLKEGNDFLAVANLYNEAADTDVSFGKNDVAKEVANKAFALENDQISGKIKTDNGFYFIKCIDHYDQDKTDANKSVILENRRKEAFDDVYQEFLTGLSSEFNEKVWQSVRVEVNDEVKTDKFFQVYEKYCNW